MIALSRCGLHKVHFLGTLQDWEEVREKVKQMGTYDDALDFW